MSLKTTLIKKAAEIRSLSPSAVAIHTLVTEHGLPESEARLEVAQQEFIKEAAMGMAAAGIDYDAAVNMVKVAAKDPNLALPIEPSLEELFAKELEKVAQVVGDLEQERDEALAQLASFQQGQAHASQVTEPMSKLASTGQFTQDDLDEMLQLNAQVLSKMASVVDSPTSLGRPSKVPGSGMDPFASWVMGND